MGNKTEAELAPGQAADLDFDALASSPDQARGPGSYRPLLPRGGLSPGLQAAVRLVHQGQGETSPVARLTLRWAVARAADSLPVDWPARLEEELKHVPGPPALQQFWQGVEEQVRRATLRTDVQ